MSFDDLKNKTKRNQIIIFQIDLDINDPEFDSEFAADLSSQGTPKTTNDIRAYLEGSIRTYSFCNQLIYGLDCFPGLISAESEPPILNPGIDIGVRATASIKLTDFLSTDSFELVDDYSNRRVEASFWAKMFARNEFRYREARILRGYSDDGYFDIDNFEVEHFIIDDYQGPTLAGDISFKLVDVLTFTDALNVKVPLVTTGILSSALPSGPETSVSFNALDTDTEYGTEGVWIINSEVMEYTITSATTATVVRARFGSRPSDHAVNATISRCLFWNNVNVIDILYDLFELTETPASYIPTTEWDLLKANELSIFNLKAVIYKQEDVKKLINELIEHCNLTMFTDVVNKKITILPGSIIDEPVIKFNNTEHILADSFSHENDFSRFITNQFIRWALKDYTKTEVTNYEKNKRTANLNSESARKFKLGSAGKEILSRWLPNTLDGNQIADQIITRKVFQYGSDIPKKIKFKTDSAYIGNLQTSGRFWLGSIFEIEAPENCLVNADGSRQTLVAQCISLKRGEADNWQVTGLTYTANFPEDSDYIIPSGIYLDYVLADDPAFAAILTAEGVKDYVVVLPQGSVFGASTTANAAFRQGTFPAGSTLKLVIYGRVLGKGGSGGRGGRLVYADTVCQENESLGGFDGGDALEFTTDAFVDVLYGLIGGGGGGGTGLRSNCALNKSGKGGGGGQGWLGGEGGLPGQIFDDFMETATEGDYGEPGGLDAQGLGGGALGEDGLTAPTNGEGGAAGAAIITNGNTVTIVAGNSPDKIKGAII